MTYQPLLGQELSLAVINRPSQSVISSLSEANAPRVTIRVAWPKGQGQSRSGSLLAVPDAARTEHRIIARHTLRKWLSSWCSRWYIIQDRSNPI
ncbi:hypothetical protein [Moorena producens]|uniref:hypothetical protein n=1 Tax=Moorena producens TaxID=1155739 RepID=UPI003C77C26F